jgi:hypothetical protein
MRAFARGLRAWWRDEESDEAVAAGCNVAEILTMARQYMAGSEG